jgi:hypothetical protein
MSRFTFGSTSRVRRSISCALIRISPVQWSRLRAYSRTASSPRASISASISDTTLRALPDSVSGVFAAFLRYSVIYLP